MALMSPQFHLAAGRPRSTPWALFLGDLCTNFAEGVWRFLGARPGRLRDRSGKNRDQRGENKVCSPLGAVRPVMPITESVIGTGSVIVHCI